MDNTESDGARDYVIDVYQAKGDPDQLRMIYDEWSSIYDDELENHHGWRGPELVASVASRRCSKRDRILDVGAGTGLVGHLLHSEGFEAIEGMDLSEGMLAKARGRGVYRAIHVADLGRPLPFSDSGFAHAVASGVFTFGHAPPESLDELIRVIAAGGVIIFTLPFSTDDSTGYVDKIKDQIRQLETNRSCVIEEVSAPVSLIPSSEPGARHQIWTLRVVSES